MRPYTYAAFSVLTYASQLRIAVHYDPACLGLRGRSIARCFSDLATKLGGVEKVSPRHCREHTYDYLRCRPVLILVGSIAVQGLMTLIRRGVASLAEAASRRRVPKAAVILVPGLIPFRILRRAH